MRIREKEILECILHYELTYGQAPSYQDICDATSITSKAVVSYNLWTLEGEGLVERNHDYSTRTTTLARNPERFAFIDGRALKIGRFIDFSENGLSFIAEEEPDEQPPSKLGAVFTTDQLRNGGAVPSLQRNQPPDG